MSRDDLLRLDGEIVRLGRCSGALRLRVGEALEHLHRSAGHHELGFSSIGVYVAERCQRSGRWGDDSRALARRLAGLPRLRDAIARGAISWSMAELLARHATAANEADLLEAAQGATVRAMRERLSGAVVPDDEPAPMRTVQRTI